jgi:hypothetical protein
VEWLKVQTVSLSPNTKKKKKKEIKKPFNLKTKGFRPAFRDVTSDLSTYLPSCLFYSPVIIFPLPYHSCGLSLSLIAQPL